LTGERIKGSLQHNRLICNTRTIGLLARMLTMHPMPLITTMLFPSTFLLLASLRMYCTPSVKTLPIHIYLSLNAAKIPRVKVENLSLRNDCGVPAAWDDSRYLERVLAVLKSRSKLVVGGGTRSRSSQGKSLLSSQVRGASSGPSTLQRFRVVPYLHGAPGGHVALSPSSNGCTTGKHVTLIPKVLPHASIDFGTFGGILSPPLPESPRIATN